MKPKKFRKKGVFFNPRNSYAKYSGRCKCGCYLTKGAWVRFERGKVVACCSCRDSSHNGGTITEEEF